MQEIVEVRWGTFAHFVRPRPSSTAHATKLDLQPSLHGILY